MGKKTRRPIVVVIEHDDSDGTICGTLVAREVREMSRFEAMRYKNKKRKLDHAVHACMPYSAMSDVAVHISPEQYNTLLYRTGPVGEDHGCKLAVLTPSPYATEGATL